MKNIKRRELTVGEYMRYRNSMIPTTKKETKVKPLGDTLELVIRKEYFTKNGKNYMVMIEKFQGAKGVRVSERYKYILYQM